MFPFRKISAPQEKPFQEQDKCGKQKKSSCQWLFLTRNKHTIGRWKSHLSIDLYIFLFYLTVFSFYCKVVISEELKFTNIITNTSKSIYPTNLSIKSINSLCYKYSEELGSNLNDTQIYLTLEILKKMHFDFCCEVEPLFVLGNCSINNANLNTKHLPCENSVKTTCEKIKKLNDIDKNVDQSYGSFEKLFSRLTYCKHDADYNPNLNALIKEECETCLPIYKDWLCTSSFDFTSNLTLCSAVTDKVCLHCPPLPPDEDYGGFSAFECEYTEQQEDFDEEDCSDDDMCISTTCLSKIYKNNNSTCQNATSNP